MTSSHYRKLDSNLLLIAPDRVRPTMLVERVLSMYEGELEEAKIAANFKIEQSYSDLCVDRALLDPARLLQVGNDEAKTGHRLTYMIRFLSTYLQTRSSSQGRKRQKRSA